jgi:cytochrome-b5 reductase
MSKAAPASNPYLSKAYIDGIYIPSGLLVVGCLVVKREWVPYAVLLALALGGWKVWSNSTSSVPFRRPQHD